jgi:hypothetical protein
VSSSPAAQMTAATAVPASSARRFGGTSANTFAKLCAFRAPACDCARRRLGISPLPDLPPVENARLRRRASRMQGFACARQRIVTAVAGAPQRQRNTARSTAQSHKMVLIRHITKLN